MYKLIEFIRRIYVVLLFILIETIALACYARSSFYTRAKILSHAASITGGVQQGVFNLRHYFTLRGENEMLASRIAELESELAYYQEQERERVTDTLTMAAMDSTLMASLSHYRYTTARVVANTINRSDNLITLNRGNQHGVYDNMAVVTPEGSMVGYIVASTERYSVAMPMLNARFNTSGKIAGDDNFGSITWDGRSPHRVQLSELTKYSNVEVGDEVIASGLSYYFPEGVRIGYVESLEENENHTSYDVEVRLSTNFTRLSNVLVIDNNLEGQMLDVEQAAHENLKNR